MSETATPRKFSVEGEQGSEAGERSGAEQSEREIAVATKPPRRRFSLEYKRRIVRRADGCTTPGAVSASPRCHVSRPRRKAMLQT